MKKSVRIFDDGYFSIVVGIIVCMVVGLGSFIHTAQAQEAELATEFIYPVLGPSVTDPRNNTVDPRVPSTSCTGGNWYTDHNDFGHYYCSSALGCTAPKCYHPGEDWNLCPVGTNENGTAVYAVANGKVVRRSTVNASNANSAYYITIEHTLPSAENTANYVYPGTTVPTNSTFSRLYSSYLHIDPSMSEGDIVTKGEQIGTISNCCSHLHFEMKTSGIGSNNCGGCGYCSSYQDLTDNHFIDPDDFIRAHTVRTQSKAAISSPANGSTFTSGTVTFVWNNAGASQYWLYVGTSAGGYNIYSGSQSTNTSATISNIPTNGSKIYVRLWSLISGNWVYNDYIYTAFSSTTQVKPAVISSPANGTTFSSGTVTFTWNNAGASQYWLYVGTSAGGSNIFNAS